MSEHKNQQNKLLLLLAFGFIFIICSFIVSLKYGIIYTRQRHVIILAFISLAFLIVHLYGINTLSYYEEFESNYVESISTLQVDKFFDNDFFTKEIATSIFVVSTLILLIALIPDSEILILLAVLIIAFNQFYVFINIKRIISEKTTLSNTITHSSESIKLKFENDLEIVMRRLLIFELIVLVHFGFIIKYVYSDFDRLIGFLTSLQLSKSDQNKIGK